MSMNPDPKKAGAPTRCYWCDKRYPVAEKHRCRGIVGVDSSDTRAWNRDSSPSPTGTYTRSYHDRIRDGFNIMNEDQ